MIRSLLIATLLIITLNFQNTGNALTWANAPLACLPERAAPWDNKAREPEPCHCPPSQDYCPVLGEIGIEDVIFYANVDVVTPNNGHARKSVSFSAQELLDYLNRGDSTQQEKDLAIDLQNRISDILKMTDAQVWKYIKGYSLFKFKDYGRITRGRNYIDLEPRQNAWSKSYQVIIAPDGNKSIMEWVNHNSIIPEQILGNCCQNVLCPTGTKTVKITENVTQPIIQFTSPDNLEEVQKKIQDKKPLNQYAGLIKPNKDEVYSEPVVTGTVTKTLDTLICRDLGATILREGCILEGTTILRADGKTLKIEELKIGDVLKTSKGEATIKAINKFTQEKDTIYGLNGGTPFITEEHPLLTTSGWKSINPDITSIKSDLGVVGKLAIGDSVITSNGVIEVQTIEKHELSGGVTAYNISLEGGESFIANDVVVHGFQQVQIHY